MTIYALALEYEETAANLRRRIMELERAGRETDDDTLKRKLEGRVRPLRSMYRDVRAVARYLERYYNKQAPEQADKAGVRKGRS